MYLINPINISPPSSLSTRKHRLEKGQENKTMINNPPNKLILPSPLQRILVLIRRGNIIHIRSLCYRRHFSIAVYEFLSAEAVDGPDTDIPRFSYSNSNC